MKVLLVNGSPNEKRCTYTALSSAASGLGDNGVAAEVVWAGKAAVRPCIACGACANTQRCAYGTDDGVNGLIEKIQGADGVILGSPVYYAGVNGAFKAMLDRVFFAGGSTFAYKPGGSVVSARRAGTTVALDQLNKYLLISQMPVVSSVYWPMVHGTSSDEVALDAEGMQTAYQLGANIAWLLKSLEAGAAAGIEPVRLTTRARTNFIH